MVKKKKEIFSILSKEMDFLKREFNVKKIGVFGSYSREEMTPASDIDILVEFSEVIGLIKFIELEALLSKKLGIKVDLVTRNALRKEIKDFILKDLVYA